MLLPEYSYKTIAYKYAALSQRIMELLEEHSSGLLVSRRLYLLLMSSNYLSEYFRTLTPSTGSGSNVFRIIEENQVRRTKKWNMWINGRYAVFYHWSQAFDIFHLEASWRRGVRGLRWGRKLRLSYRNVNIWPRDWRGVALHRTLCTCYPIRQFNVSWWNGFLVSRPILPLPSLKVHWVMINKCCNL